MRSTIVSGIALTAALAAGLPASGHGAAAAAAPKPAAAPRRAVLPFIADDYEKAVAEAKARKVPLFVESWAPW